jgi:hypothetical protein
MDQPLAFYILRAVNLVTDKEFQEGYINACKALGPDEWSRLDLNGQSTVVKPDSKPYIQSNLYPMVVILFDPCSYFILHVRGR